MSQNPYAQPRESDFEYYEEPQRTSLLAITALIFSLACCIPGVSAIGLVLGGVSLALINAAQGRLAGRGMALAAVIVGLMVTVLQGAGVIGIYQSWRYYSVQLVPAAERVLVAAAAGDLGAVQAGFTNGEDITPKQAQRFVSIIESEVGANPGIDTSFGDLLETFWQTYTGRSSGTTINAAGTGDWAPVPVVIRGDRGTLLGWAIFDETTTNTPNLKMFDFLVQLPGTDSFALRSSDIAKETSLRLGSQMLRADETPGAPAPEGPAAAPDEETAEPPV